MKENDLIASAWPDYELIDSGLGQKLERYGKFVVVRPETQALWAPSDLAQWKRAAAEFQWAEGKGSWKKAQGAPSFPEEWELLWNDIRFMVRLTSFKHTGVFPEQAPNWEWVRERVKALGGNGVRAAGARPQVLNLFGYTGIASIAATKEGADVTQVDASKQSNAWAKENAARSGVADGIRYLLDDALKFVEREVRRGACYDGVILDPPAFGRGAKGEVWHIETHLPRLLGSLKKLLAERRGAFFLLNGYAAGYSPRSFLQAVEGIFPEAADKAGDGEFGELSIKESSSLRRVPSGIYVRFSRG